MIGKPKVADGGRDGHDPQGELIDTVAVGKDQPHQGQLGPEGHRQTGKLDRVRREGGAQDALLGGVAA